MLHIVLGILKIFGILLGILLLLLLAGILSLVFVPVRYRLSAKVKSGQYEFSLRGSWLLHLISASVSGKTSGGQRIEIRLLGIRLPLFRETTEQSSGSRKKKVRRKNTDKKVHRKKTDEKAHQKKTDEKVHRKKTDKKAHQKKTDEKAHQQKTDKNARKKEQNQGQGQDSSKTAPKMTEEPQDELEQTDAEFAAGESAQNVLQKIRFQCSRICDKIKQIIQKLREFAQKLVSFKQRAAELGRRGLELLHKPGELLELAEAYEAKEVLGSLTGHLLFLIGHYKPRRIEGYLRFGMDDPSKTGQLTGLIYILLPARADHFSVEPQFNETIFETETVCSGHIRAFHVLRVLWRCIRDKRLRRILREVRGSKK